MGWNFVRILVLIPIALAIGAASASAAPIFIDFESEPALPPDDCIPENGVACQITDAPFTSFDSTQIHFEDTAPLSPEGDLLLIKESFTNDTNALAVGYDFDDSALRIVLDLPATSISMDLFVGSEYSPEVGDTAVLTAFRDTVEVGSVSVGLGAPDISFDCALSDCGTFDSFNRVEVEFVVEGGLTEIVDNVNANLIPEPHAAVVFGAGALLVGAACGRRSRSEVGLRARRR